MPGIICSRMYVVLSVAGLTFSGLLAYRAFGVRARAGLGALGSSGIFWAEGKS